jgi:Fe2+ transport system protein B
MPRQPIERRDNTVLQAVLEIQKDTSKIITSQAVTETKLSAVEEHLKNLNSKVATQEARQQELGSTQTLLAATIASLQKRDDREDEQRSWLQRLTIEKILGFVMTIAIAYLLFKTGIH